MIYLIRCRLHPDFLYVGSTINTKKRWANHKSDAKLKKTKKCRVAAHVGGVCHPTDPQLSFITIIPIEHVEREERLLERELYWMANLGTLETGGNERVDVGALMKRRIQY